MKTLEQIRAEIKRIPASQAKRHDKIKEVLMEIVERLEPDSLDYLRTDSMLKSIKEVHVENNKANNKTKHPFLGVRSIPKKGEKDGVLKGKDETVG